MSAPLARVSGRKPVRWTTILGLMLVPLTVAGVLLWGLWNPTERLDTVTAAVVNHDEPVELDGQLVPLGRLLAGSLIDGPPEADDADARSAGGTATSAAGSGTTKDPAQNFTWILTDAEDAEAGLDDGRYATVVTIPENFSAAATSLSGDPDDAEQATIDIRESDRGRLIDTALSSAVTQTATQLLNTQLGEQFVGGVFVGMGEIRKGVGGAADGAAALADGGKQLADGTTALADGAQELAAGTQELASGAGQLAGGAGALSGGAGELAGGAGALSGGAGSLASGAGTLSTGVAELAAGAGELSAGATELSAGTGELAGGLRVFVDGDGTADNPGLSGFAAGARDSAAGADALANGLAEYSGGVNQLLGPILQGSGEVTAVLDQLTAGITDGSIPMPDEDTKQQALAAIAAIHKELATASGQIEQLYASGPVLADGARAAANGAVELADGAQGLAGGAADLASGAEQLSGGASELAAGAAGVSAGTSQLAGGASELAGGAAELAGGASDLAGGASALAGGASELATGASGLAAGTSELAASTPALAEGAAELADGAGKSAQGASALAKGLGQAVSGIPNYTEAQRDTLAETALAPVAAEGGSDELFNASGVPLFAGIALWAGALAAFLVLAPLWRRTREAARGVGAITLRSALPALGLGAAQGAIAGIVLPLALGYSFGAGAAFFGLALLAGIAFTLLVQGLSALLGGFGRFIAFVLLVVAFAVGIVSTVPGPLAALGDASPIGAALAGFQAIATGAAGAGGAAALLALWALAGLALTALAVRRARAA